MTLQVMSFYILDWDRMRFLAFAFVLFSLLESIGVLANEAVPQLAFYSDQKVADANLDAFDKANPTCQMWTNWQKMCGRIDRDGKSHCVSDSDRPVKPSAPFCIVRHFSKFSEVSVAKVDSLLTAESIITQLSRNRYCKEYYPSEPLARESGQLSVDVRTDLRICKFYRFDHPFGPSDEEIAKALNAAKENRDSIPDRKPPKNSSLVCLSRFDYAVQPSRFGGLGGHLNLNKFMSISAPPTGPYCRKVVK